MAKLVNDSTPKLPYVAVAIAFPVYVPTVSLTDAMPLRVLMEF